MKHVANLLSGMPDASRSEITEVLVSGRSARLERIVSHGQASPPGFWYDQDTAEWVLLLTGAARIRFEGDAGEVALGPGDYIEIPAHTKHRVEWTEPAADTVWLAIHFS